MQILVQHLGRGQQRFWISNKLLGDADAAGSAMRDSEAFSRAGRRMLNNSINLIQ